MKPVNIAQQVQNQVHFKISYSLRREISTRVTSAVRDRFIEQIDSYITDVMYINLYEKMEQKIEKELK